MSPRCPRCGRPVWDGGGPISERSCHYQDGTECRLTAQRDALLGAIARLSDIDDPTVRTAKAVAEQIQGTVAKPTSCPLCGSYDAVRKGAVALHFAKVTDSRPCPASLKNLGAFK